MALMAPWAWPILRIFGWPSIPALRAGAPAPRPVHAAPGSLDPTAGPTARISHVAAGLLGLQYAAGKYQIWHLDPSAVKFSTGTGTGVTEGILWPPFKGPRGHPFRAGK